VSRCSKKKKSPNRDDRFLKARPCTVYKHWKEEISENVLFGKKRVFNKEAAVHVLLENNNVVCLCVTFDLPE